MLLQNLQTELAEMLLSDEQVPLCVSSDVLSPLCNSAIYQNTILANLTHTLSTIYTMIVRLVGKDFFHSMAKDYIKRYPSCSGNLHDYGEYFSRFLDDYPPVNHVPYLAEVATFEWFCHTLDFAPDHAPFNLALLKTIPTVPPHQLYFKLHPASQVLQFHYPLLEILALCKDKISTLDMSARLQKGATYLLLLRREWTIIYESLSMGDSIFLKSLHENLSLSEAVTAAIAIEPNFNLEEKLPHWIKNNVIVDVAFTAA
jgi:hypothetical protein